MQHIASLAAITRMFSSSVFHELARKSRSSLVSRLIEQSNLMEECPPNSTLSDAFESAFSLLKISGNRDEYVYRSAIAQKILLGKHSLQTAVLLNEVRAGSCKADTVVLNGTSTVYEIKSERDSLARLQNQVANYKRVFASINVITSQDHFEAVRKIVPDEVGLMILTDRFQISTRREALSHPEKICPETVLESLRASEAIEILNSLGVGVPQVPNTQLRAMLRSFFANLDPTELHFEMVRVLKETRTQAPLKEFVNLLPASLKAAALSSQTNEAGRNRILNALATPLDVALSWK